MAKMIIEVELDQDATQMAALWSKDVSAPKVEANAVAQMFEAIASGNLNGVFNVKTGAVPASLVGTFTGDPTAAETVTINGVAFTARASGAVANEYNIGANVTAHALALANAINASVTAGVADVIYAVPLAGAVTLYSKQAGKVGNAIVVAENTTNFAFAGAATKLASGTQGTNKTYVFGKAATNSY
jgi:hypothetical protein